MPSPSQPPKSLPLTDLVQENEQPLGGETSWEEFENRVVEEATNYAPDRGGDEDEIDWGCAEPPMPSEEEVRESGLTKNDFRKEKTLESGEDGTATFEVALGDSSDAALEFTDVVRATLGGEVTNTAASAAAASAASSPLQPHPQQASPWASLQPGRMKEFQKATMLQLKGRIDLTGHKRWRDPSATKTCGLLSTGVDALRDWFRGVDGAEWDRVLKHTWLLKPDGRDMDAFLQQAVSRAFARFRALMEDDMSLLPTRSDDDWTGLRSRYTTLLHSLPKSCYDRLATGVFHPEDKSKWTDADKWKALLKLTQSVRGELVEVARDLDEQRWYHCVGECPDMPPAGGDARTICNAQFLCKEAEWVKGPNPDYALNARSGRAAYKTVMVPRHPESSGGSEQYGMVRKVTSAARNLPDWPMQRNRLVCPCVGSQGGHWERSARVVNLAELFLLLGEVWPADTIYAYYEKQRIVAVKHKRREKSMSDKTLGGISLGMQTHLANEFKRDTSLEVYFDEMGWYKDSLPPKGSELREKIIRDCAVHCLGGLTLRSVDPSALSLPGQPHQPAGVATFSLGWETLRNTLLRWDLAKSFAPFGIDVQAYVEKRCEEINAECVGAVGMAMWSCRVRDCRKNGARASQGSPVKFSSSDRISLTTPEATIHVTRGIDYSTCIVGSHRLRIIIYY